MMTRTTHVFLAALFAALLSVFVLVPARAASIPAAATQMIDQAAKPQVEQARYHRRRSYRRPVYVRRHVYRRAYYRPVYYGYRRCWNRPRVFWTPYGYVRRWVRVCRY